jgi:putative transposase
VSARPIMDAIIYRGRTGCQWNRLPEEYPDDSTVHRAFQRWKQAGVFRRLWAVLIERCEDLDGVDWEWQAVDGAMGKARKGGAMWGPTRPTVPRVA